MAGVILLIILASIVAQFVVGSKLNATRKQSSYWWIWVLMLGWLGVIIIACQRPLTLTAPAPTQIVYVVDPSHVPTNTTTN